MIVSNPFALLGAPPRVGVFPSPRVCLQRTVRLPALCNSFCPCAHDIKKKLCQVQIRKKKDEPPNLRMKTYTCALRRFSTLTSSARSAGIHVSALTGLETLFVLMTPTSVPSHNLHFPRSRSSESLLNWSTPDARNILPR